MTEDMPTFEPFPANPPHVKNCIHCHTVGEAEMRETIAAGRLALRDVWPFPPAQNIGLEIDAEDGLRIESVRDGSAAQRAGIEADDILERLDDQPLTSEADIQWVLHHAPDEGTLPAIVRRGEQLIEVTIDLEENWRRSDGHWRGILEPLRPHVILRTDPYKVQKGAEPGQMGLEVAYPRGPAAEAGLRNGDLVIAVDGRSDMLLEADFLKYIHFDQPDAKSIALTVIRKGAKLNLTLPAR
jgi:S1-C subfamily serine protease